MNMRALTAALITLALAACTSTPTTTPTQAPTASPGASATAVVTPPASATPTLPPTPTIEPTATPTVTPTPAPTVEPTPVANWMEPELIAQGTFQETDIVVDSQGFVHGAAAGYGPDNRGIWYFTNASGSWASQRVSTPPREEQGDEYDGEPSIALDTDGSVWIAFARWSCWDCAPNPPESVFVATNASGAWSEAEQLADCMCGGPSLNVRDGIAYLAYHEYGGWYFGTRNWPVWYATNASGAWLTTQVTKKGATPQLALDADGSVQILYYAPNDIRLVTQLLDGSFGQVEILPGSSDGYDLDLAVDAGTGAMWAGWSQSSADHNHINVMVASRGPGGWSQPEMAIADGDLTGLGAGQGLLHASAVVSDLDHWGGLLYATNLSGSFATEKLAEAGGDTSSVALDASGRADLVYSIDEPKSDRGLWLVHHT